MNMYTFWHSSTQAQREELATAVDTSTAYLYMLVTGRRRASPKLCRKLIRADGRFTLVDLRPDIYGEASNVAVSAQEAAA